MVIEFLKSSPLLLELTRAFVAIILALIFVLVNAIIFIYLERKVWARVM
jgi:NADH:ubiquinone oxidoreductase subunit H